jgi:hypothetical protein
MALVGNNRGTGGNVTAATTIGISPQQNFSANTLAVLALAYDNSGGGGADPYSSITDSVGNLWTSRANGLNDPGAASAGSTIRIFTATVSTLNTTDTITVTFGSSTTAKSWTLTEFSSNTADFGADFLSAGTPATGTGTTPSTGSISVTSGDAIFGAMANEGNATVTADSDTTNGAWSTQQTINNGTGTSGMQVASQFKIVNATGNQTYNLTLSASGDWVVTTIQITEVSLVTASDPMGMFGFFGV